MADQEAASAKYHVLLIGVDHYPGHELQGCVNDIDLVQRVLLGDRMGLAQDRIRRLASPLPGSSHETAVPEKPATLANIREALSELGSERVSPGDRVFIYYAGHGARVSLPNGNTSHRAALVPADYSTPSGPRFLYDHEVNEALRRIVARTRSVTAVLDCCFAAGATRDPGGARFIEVSAPAPDSAPGSRGDGEPDEPGVGGIDDCHVVSACMNHQIAREDIRDGRKNGLLTRSFIDAIQAATDARLPTLTWARIWQSMQDYIQANGFGQVPWMSGSPGRAVFGGPPVNGDPGIPVTRDGDGYRIAAGTLAGITRNAVLAVYGEQPRDFPVLQSAGDLAARRGLLRVVEATAATATATVEGSAFELPFGARGRLVTAGDAARLRCAVVPSDPALESQLRESALLELVDPARARVKLEQHDHRWFVTDDIHGTGAPEPVLFALQPDKGDCARAVLEHYHAYARPLQIAALTTDAPRHLELTVRTCSQPQLPADQAQVENLPMATSTSAAAYALTSGSLVCFQVHNRGPRPLRVTLVNCAASGKVQLLGDQVIDAKGSYAFWAHDNLGEAFTMKLADGAIQCVDRLIAIGRTELERDLTFLQVPRTFAQTVEQTRNRASARASDDGDATPAVYWTTAQVDIVTRTPPPASGPTATGQNPGSPARTR